MDFDRSRPVVDMAAFTELAPTPSLRAMMAAAFVRHLPEITTELDAAAHSSDGPADWRDAVHKLKGSCLMVGAQRTANVLEHWEQHAASMTAPERQAANRQLTAELQALSQALSALMN